MTLVEIFLLALALSADAFSVGAVVGATACERRQRFRLSFHFGLFQTLMPLLGALLGRVAVEYLEAYTHWIACGLLSAIGVKMIIDGLSEKEGQEAAEKTRERNPDCVPADRTRGWSLVALSLATSIDALGAGLGVGLVLETGRLLFAAAVIGVTCGTITWLGMRSGALVRRYAGRWVEPAGGLVLIGLGIRMLWG
ncbi:MAG: manganese efflux pump [Myxococcales bacterium]|nr:manganese efflux pump [Myxococcales bacterium]